MPLIPIDRTLFESKLIEELKQHPNLYTKRSQLDFHEYNTIEQSWDIVAKIMDSDNKTCKKIWRNLRDSYVRQLKKISCSAELGIDTSQFTKWKHFDKMSFLKNVISHRTINESRSNDQNSLNGKAFKFENIELEGNSISSEAVSDKETFNNDNPSLIIDSDNCELSNSFLSKTNGSVNYRSNGNDDNFAKNFLRKQLKVDNNDLEVNSISSDQVSDKETFQRPGADDDNNLEISNSFLTKTCKSVNLTNIRAVSEEAFGHHIAKSLENLSAVRRSVAKVKIQEILSEFEQEDARDPIHFMPNFFLNPFK